MRLASLLLIVAAATAGPLPGLQAVPDRTQVAIAREDLQSFVGTGTVDGTVLTITAPSARLPANERVVVWFVLPTKGQADKFSFPGRTSQDGADVNLETPEKVSLKKVLKDAYRIELRFERKK
ncbi:MAG TPA: hypothetical protein VNT60_05425 [Deinococcales bacterium]|nr:hypothetical protein [Deinococcales bacterium]